MKIGLYGVSRCGKDYFIRHILETAGGLKHICGSETLKRLARERFGVEFTTLREEDKNALRVVLTEEARCEEKRSGNIIVDGHFSFPTDENRFRVVFTEADKLLYDVFVYMNTNPERVLENQKKLDSTRVVRQYTQEEIDAWQKFEINELQAVCKALGKELQVIDGDIDCAASYITELIRVPEHILPEMIAKRIVDAKRGTFECVDTIVLMDCDKTLAINDTTIPFCDASGIDKQAIRNNYRGEYYSTYQFYRANRFYDKVLPDERYFTACKYAASAAQMNTALIADIKSGVGNHTMLAVTAGILDVWERIQETWGFPNIVVGKGRANEGGFYVSTLVKRAIVEELRVLGKRVIAIGDSPIDIGMLEAADQGYIVAMQKLSSGVEVYLAKTSNNKIRQLAYSPYKYNGVMEVYSIWQS